MKNNTLSFYIFVCSFVLICGFTFSSEYDDENLYSYDDEDDIYLEKIDTVKMFLSKHIGWNGYFVDISIIYDKIYNSNTDIMSKFSMGSGFLPNIGFGGDVLTGLDVLHIIPSFYTWGIKEPDHEYSGDKVRRFFSVNFASSFVSPRLTNRQLRIIAGLGPIVELELLYRPDPGNESVVLRGYSMFYGLAGRLGLELPIENNYSLIMFISYSKNYTFFSSFNSALGSETYYESHLKHEKLYFTTGLAF